MDKKYQLNRLDKTNFEIIATISWKEIQDSQDLIIKEVGKEIEIKGFRKGSAPSSLVAETIGPSKLIEKALNKILPGIYHEAITKFKLSPIVAPKIEFVKVKEKEDWQIKLTSCESPIVTLGNYKEEIKKIKDTSIWIPGKTTGSEKQTENREKKLDKIISWLIETIKVEISDLLIEEEVNHKLSELLSETQKLGITIDKYLQSTEKTIDSLKTEYKLVATRNLQLEFILTKISEEESIKVEPEEIEKAIEKADEKDKSAMSEQKYLLAVLIKQQKTLDFLANL